MCKSCTLNFCQIWTSNKFRKCTITRNKLETCLSFINSFEVVIYYKIVFIVFVYIVCYELSSNEFIKEVIKLLYQTTVAKMISICKDKTSRLQCGYTAFSRHQLSPMSKNTQSKAIKNVWNLVYIMGRKK